MVNWDILTLPRRLGGIGIRDARLSNAALLGKLVWWLIHEQHRPWVQILRHRYVCNSDILELSPGSGSSYMWCSIMKALSMLQDGWCYRL